MNFFENEKRLIVVLILVSGLLFFVGLGRMALTDPDEVFYAETAREMHNRGEFLTPRIFGQPQFEKPPLYYWLVALSFGAFGVNEFSARLASVIFGIFGVLGVYFLGKILISKRAGFLAGIVLATNIKYVILARACVTDMVLCVFILYAFLCFFYGHLSNSKGTKWYLLSAVFLGLSVLTKGPIGIFLPFVITAIYLICTRESGKLKKIPFAKCILLFLAVSLPWYILMYRTHGKEFIDMFFGFHNIIRFLEPEHKIGDVFYYYFPATLAGFFPWSAFLPIGIWQIIREKDIKIRKTNIFLVAWVLVIFVFFSISRTKLPTYTFPIYPALALFMGRLLEVLFKGGLTRRQTKGMGVLTGILFVSITAGLAVLYVALKGRYPSLINAALLAGSLFAALMAVSAWHIFRKRYARGLAIYIASFVFFLSLLSVSVLYEIGKYESSKNVSKKILSMARPDEMIGAETHYRRGVAFYTKRENIPDIHAHDAMTGFFEKRERVWGVIKEKNYNQLYDDKNQPYDSPSYMMYKFGKKVIITNKLLPGETYIKKKGKHATR
ncbi:MAG: glycosyltransferase family 39 protein [Omnitrophica bacterium]|nr:glycosyltransferase family 39 protein [Candidatus Omnitrophota bacterium]